MKPILIVPTLREARWVEFPDVIVVSAEWLAQVGALGDPRLADHRIFKPQD